MNMICIVCPNSCRLIVEETADGLAVSDGKCLRGREFAVNEYTNPKRMLASTVKIAGAVLRRLPVITTEELPKSKIFEAQNVLKCIAVEAPIRCRDIVVRDICGTGVDVVASRSMDAVSDSN